MTATDYMLPSSAQSMAANLQRRSQRRRRVLLIEPDAELAQSLIEAMWAYGGLEPTHVENLGQARAALQEMRVEAVVSETHLPDGFGYRLLKEIRRGEHGRELPILLLSDEQRTRVKVAAFKCGAADYVVKPVAVGELCARIDAAARHTEEIRLAARERGFSLAGDFSGMSFPELVGLLHNGRRSGRLSIETPQARGQLLWVDGQIYHLHFGERWGEEAFYVLTREFEGRFEFFPEPLDPNAIPNTVALAPMALLVEGARRMDELARDGAELPQARRARPWPAPNPDPALAEVVAGLLQPDAAQLRMSLRSAEELQGITAAPVDDSRLLCVLVGDPARLGGALMKLGELDPAEVLAKSFEPGPRALCASWVGPGASRLDVVLLDHHSPARMLQAIRREPAMVCVVPPEGRWRDLGIRARAELSSLLARLRPQAVFGLGVIGLQAKLRELLAQAGLEADCAMLDAADDPRVWLVEAVTRWGESGGD